MTLRFPTRKHVLSASVSIRGIKPLVADLRHELARVVRDFAALQVPEVRDALLKCADMFEAIPDPPPETPRVRPITRNGV